MLERVPNTYSSSFQYVGKDELTGYNEYIVPVRENNKKRITNIDDGLFDDYDEIIIDELPQLEDDCQLQTTEQKNLSFTDFSEMDFRQIYYHIYQELKLISSLLSTKQEVGKDGKKL